MQRKWSNLSDNDTAMTITDACDVMGTVIKLEIEVFEYVWWRTKNWFRNLK